MSLAVCKNREELYKFIESVDYKEKKDHKYADVYYHIKYNGYDAMYSFFHYKGCHFESQVYLNKWPMTENELREYIEEDYLKEAWDEIYEYEKRFLVDGYHYEIEIPHCDVYFEKDIEILDVVTEMECFRWLLEKEKK